jgi:hypothetical protein
MKIRYIAIIVLTLWATTASAAQIITISKFQYGKQWAFTQEEVQLLCRADQSLFALNMSTLMQYPLNEKATSEMLSGHVKAMPINSILLDDPAKPNQKMSIAPFAARAQQLCDKK